MTAITFYIDFNRLGSEWIMSGTHAGDFPALPATGKRFSIRAASFLEFHQRNIHRTTDSLESHPVFTADGTKRARKSIASCPSTNERRHAMH